MIKFLHAADFHLDSHFAALRAEKARDRRREARDRPDRLADLALAEQVDVVLLSGDLFDGEQVYPETVERLRAALARITCPVFIAPGNHDPYTAHSPYAAAGWPDNVHIFREEMLTAVPLPELGCVVHGAAFAAPERSSQVLDGWTAPRDGLLHLLCLHADVDGADSSYGPVSRAQLAACGADYAALGHIHQYSGLQRQGGAFWAYPGCPEGRGFDELGEKGVLVGTLERGRAEARFVPLCRRRYWVLRADVTDREPAAALRDVLPETADRDVCRVVFTGETGEQGVDLPALGSAFADACYALELRDLTRPAESLWARAGEDSLRGLFLQELRARYDRAPEGPEREKIVQAARFGLAALDGRDIG